MSKYFMYSRMQQKSQDNIAAGISKKYIPGKVYAKGVWNPYTEILNTPTSSFSDATVVISSENNSLEDIKYTDPNFGAR